MILLIFIDREGEQRWQHLSPVAPKPGDHVVFPSGRKSAVLDLTWDFSEVNHVSVVLTIGPDLHSKKEKL